jgi:hypothetical protein
MYKKLDTENYRAIRQIANNGLLKAISICFVKH